jgi:repressor LexA
MTARELARIRRQRGLTQNELANFLKTTRVTIARYETGARRIPPLVESIMKETPKTSMLPMFGVVAAGKPIEPVAQAESVEVPSSMVKAGDNFVLKITGESMRDDGILPGDLVVVRKQAVAQTGERVIALVNGQATVKKYFKSGTAVELRPVNSAMAPIIIRASDDLRIQGVVVGLIRHYR